MNSYIYIILAYLIGSIPFGLILTYAAGLGDIRKMGSGNIGATNVARSGNKLIAFITLLLDVGKGVLPIYLLIKGIAEPNKILTLDILPFAAGLAAIIGHIFPIWLKFKGGKGVATFLGTLLILNWIVGLAFIGTWLFVFLIFRVSSVSSLASVLIVPMVAYFFSGQLFGIFASIAGMIIIIRHNENINRLISGEEKIIQEDELETAE